MNSYLSPRMMVGAAIVGIVGAAGMYIYEQMYAEKRRAMLVREVARLDKQVASMRTELESLRELQKETNLRRVKQKKVRRPRQVRAVPSGDVHDAPEASDSEYFTDYQSVLGTDGDSEEFYDVPTDDDDDDDTLRLSLNGHSSQELPEETSDKSEPQNSPSKNAT